MRAAALVVIGVVALAAGCGGTEKRPADAATPRSCAPTEGGPAEVTAADAGTPSRVRLRPGMELEATREHVAAARRGGEPLRVHGVVRAQDCSPVAGATLHAWQTNAAGDYGPGDRCCYLSGTVRTDARGRYALDSVVPGTYGGTPRHIHMEVGHPRAAGLAPELILEDNAGPVVTFDIVLRRRR
jgi:protocatechuate 3,4-dioxygenase beta subunit